VNSFEGLSLNSNFHRERKPTRPDEPAWPKLLNYKSMQARLARAALDHALDTHFWRDTV